MILFWLNLALRLLLASYVVAKGHWIMGDTSYYLDTQASVCAGAWGGDMHRTPGYAWFLCVFSTKGAIFAQSLLIWACGLMLARRVGRTIALFWIFDPMLLAYSNFVMSDGLFAVMVLFLGFAMQSALAGRTASRRAPLVRMVLLGAAIAGVALVRPIGIPLGVFCLAALLYLVFRGRMRPWQVAVAMVAAVAVLSPRLYWNATRYQTLALAHQGSSWSNLLAGTLQYHGSGLDPYEIEKKFEVELRNKGPWYPLQTIVSKFHIWLLYTARGMARVLIGHVNVEWSALIAGIHPVGPAWFGAGEHRAGAHVSGLWILPWVFGIFVVAALCLYVYLRIARALLRNRRHLDVYAVWLLSSAALLAFIPQLFGDARFRSGVWPLALLLWGWLEAKPTARPARLPQA